MNPFRRAWRAVPDPLPNTAAWNAVRLGLIVGVVVAAPVVAAYIVARVRFRRLP